MNVSRVGAFLGVVFTGCSVSIDLPADEPSPSAPGTPAATSAPATATPTPAGGTEPLGTVPQVTQSLVSPTQPPAGVTPTAQTGPDPVELGEPGDVPIAPPAPGPEPASRARHRVDIDQLNATIRRATGGIGWSETRSNGEVIDLFEDLSLTLGRPDYIDLTQEDLAPSTLFQKFLGDAARAVCGELMTAELSSAPEQRVFFVHIAPEVDPRTTPEAAQANLSMLLLRFHGRHVPVGDAALNPWTWLLESAMHVAPDAPPAAAWEATCVALITHPDFYTY